MQWITKRGVVRLTILLIVVLGTGTWTRCIMLDMPGHSYRAALPPLSDRQIKLSAELKAYVFKLANQIGERNIWNEPSLGLAAAYIEQTLCQASLLVRRQRFEAWGKQVENVEATVAGHTQPEQMIVIGAHYDSVAGSPGANDNATGVAALLALARALAQSRCRRTIRFVAFVNEEPPFFQTDQMGSLVYAKQCRENTDDIVAMISFDGLGYYSDQKRSQQYPFPFNLMYPSIGNFVGFVGNTRSRSLVRQSIGVFRRNTQFPSEWAALPGAIPGVGWSDHWAFWQCDYAAVMVTDTLPYRYRYYHEPTDTAEHLDFDRMARVVDGMQSVIEEFAGAEMR